MLANVTRLPDSPANVDTNTVLPVTFLLEIRKEFFFFLIVIMSMFLLAVYHRLAVAEIVCANICYLQSDQ